MQNINVIVDNCSTFEMLDQLIEECGELIQACVKFKRAYNQTTPVTIFEARKKLQEELADVAVASAVVFFGVLTPAEQEEELETEKEKIIRWKDRLEALKAKGGA